MTVTILTGFLGAAVLLGQAVAPVSSPAQWAGVAIEHNQYTPDVPINGAVVYAKRLPDAVNVFGANYPTYLYSAVRFYSAGPVSQLWTAPKEFRLVTSPQTGIAQKVHQFGPAAVYALFNAGAALAPTNTGTQAGLSIATGAFAQVGLGKGWSIGPEVTWMPNVSALQALKDSQLGAGLLVGWGK